MILYVLLMPGNAPVAARFWILRFFQTGLATTILSWADYFILYTYFFFSKGGFACRIPLLVDMAPFTGY